MEVADKELIKLCKRKNREGFDLLFQKYERYIYKICYFYASSKDDSLDLVQEIYMKIFKSLDSFDEDKALLPWIKRITINTCINFLKKNNKGVISLNESTVPEEDPLELKLVSSENTEQQILYQDTKKVVENSIRELPYEIRMAIILRHIKGYSYKAISDLMSCPEGTVKTYIHRGRNLLKKSLIKKGIWEV
ncbi:MAG TPA: RNA polymerase sigma factor [Pseudobacteroides sp.]|uniref:RNA polymerase sigma factor n=1 Tax=Pseudobacteroides sp. TaxID=1968840 RepID=UPI002F9364B0